MAASGERPGVPGSLIWTFIIRGGEPFDLTVKGKLGPALNHDGTLTVWKMLGTEEEAASVESMIVGPLIGARVERHTEVEDDEMLAIRQARLTGNPASEG